MSAFKLYGKDTLCQQLAQMEDGARLAHGFFFYGDTGLGKKTLAQWFAARLLCTAPQKPCGSCKSCRSIAASVHPDVLWVPHSGKKGGFSVETVRSICADLLQPPNSGERKCYIFADCDEMDPRSQNILLKAIEEPPDYAYFLFTARGKQALLPTIRSRILAMPVFPCTEAVCRTALLEHGCTAEEADAAIACFHGNIGACLSYLDPSSMLHQTVSLTKQFIHSIINKDEYMGLCVANQVGKDRDLAYALLLALDAVLRDALALRYDAALPCIGCDPEGAAALSRTLSATDGQAMHLLLDRALRARSANVNVQLLLAALLGEWMNQLTGVTGTDCARIERT